MPYVYREGPKIASVYSRLQPGTAEEFLPDDAPEIIQFIAQQAADQAAIAAAAADSQANRQTAKADAFVAFLATKSPAEVAARVQADVTDLASAKVVLTKLAIAVSVLARNALG